MNLNRIMIYEAVRFGPNDIRYAHGFRFLETVTNTSYLDVLQYRTSPDHMHPLEERLSLVRDNRNKEKEKTSDRYSTSDAKK